MILFLNYEIVLKNVYDVTFFVNTIYNSGYNLANLYLPHHYYNLLSYTHKYYIRIKGG